jgi:hypothetical protein
LWCSPRFGGGIAGLIVGFITARIIAANYGPGFAKELGGALGVVLVIAGFALLLCRLGADVPPKIDGLTLNLEVEFRFPISTDTTKPPIVGDEWVFQLDSLSGHTRRSYRTGRIQTNTMRLESGRWIVPTEVFLFTERGQRSAVLARAGTNEAFGFLLPLPRRPNAGFETWSDWLPRQQGPGQPWPEDKMSCRFRVQKIPPPPPQKSQAEWRAEQAAAEEAEFAAIPADAPVQSWFPYIAYERPQTARAWQIIAGRSNLTAELGNLALGADAELAGAALRCLSALPNPTADFVPPVETVGRDIAERIRKFNDTTVEQDPSYLGAADVSIRFSAWMEATRKLRDKCSGDFTPELQPILELSRVRTDSHAMRADVCRVASYYLHQWAGIAPLPTDPKPR